MNITTPTEPPTDHRPLALAVGMAAAICITLTGCSSSPNPAAPIGNNISAAEPQPAATPEPAVDPCTLLTPAEAATLLGGPAQHKADPPTVIAQGNGLDVTGHTCAYDLITSDQSGHEIRIEIESGATRSYFDQDIQPADETPIPGLGDAAFGSSNHVKVFSNNTMIQIYGSLPAADGLQQGARLVIAKL